VGLLPDQRVGLEGYLLRRVGAWSIDLALATDADVAAPLRADFSIRLQAVYSLSWSAHNEARMRERTMSQHAGCDPVARNGQQSSSGLLMTS
jgi:hypothetical protein